MYNEKFVALIVADDDTDLMDDLTNLASHFAVLKTHITFDVIAEDIVAMNIEEYGVVVYECYRTSDEHKIGMKRVNIWWNKCNSYAVRYMCSTYVPNGETHNESDLVKHIIYHCTKTATRKSSGTEYYVAAMVNIKNDEVYSPLDDMDRITKILRNISEETNGEVRFTGIRISTPRAREIISSYNKRSDE